MITFQEVILRLQEYWNKQGCALLQPIDIEVVPAPRIRPPSCVHSVRNRGVLPMCSRLVARRTPATVKIPTVCINTINIRWC